MASRGFQQLYKLKLCFCDWGGILYSHIGSSKGVRDFFKSDDFFYFINNNKANFEFYLKRGYHPFIRAIYANGFMKDVPLRNNTTKDVKLALYRVSSQCILC